MSIRASLCEKLVVQRVVGSLFPVSLFFFICFSSSVVFSLSSPFSCAAFGGARGAVGSVAAEASVCVSCGRGRSCGVRVRVPGGVAGGVSGENINIIFLPVFLLLFSGGKGLFCDRRHGLGRPPRSPENDLCHPPTSPCFVGSHCRAAFGFEIFWFLKMVKILETKEFLETVTENCEICWDRQKVNYGDITKCTK